MTIVTEWYLKKSPLIQTTNKRLYGPGHREPKVNGSVKATLATEKANSQQDLYVIRNLKETLLRGPAFKAINLLKAINTVKIERHQ